MSTVWWGNALLGEGELGFWRIGPLDLYCSHGSDEWVVAWHRCKASVSQTDAGPSIPHGGEIPPEIERDRFALRHSGGSINLQPIMPDRSVVVNPKTVFRVPPRERSRVFLRLPLWARLELCDPRGTATRLLRDVPIQHLSDTWFGPNFYSGEVLYSAKADVFIGRPNKDGSNTSSLIGLEIANDSDEILNVEKIFIPATSLSIFRVANDEFVSENIAITYLGGGKFSEIEVRAPEGVGQSKPIAAPRERGVKTFMGRTVDRIFTSQF